MRIVAVADIHGDFPEIPPCDLLLIAGDVCPRHNHNLSFQRGWLEVFKCWLKITPAENVALVAGNHDFIFEREPPYHLPVKYLEDDYYFVNGLKIYGTPWQPYHGGWAFNLYEHDLEEKWAKIPEDTDILVCHSPPTGYGDAAPRIIKGEDEEKWPEPEPTGAN